MGLTDENKSADNFGRDSELTKIITQLISDRTSESYTNLLNLCAENHIDFGEYEHYWFPEKNENGIIHEESINAISTPRTLNPDYLTKHKFTVNDYELIANKFPINIQDLSDLTLTQLKRISQGCLNLTYKPNESHQKPILGLTNEITRNLNAREIIVKVYAIPIIKETVPFEQFKENTDGSPEEVFIKIIKALDEKGYSALGNATKNWDNRYTTEPNAQRTALKNIDPVYQNAFIQLFKNKPLPPSNIVRSTDFDQVKDAHINYVYKALLAAYNAK